jgi:hypothetical protein
MIDIALQATSLTWDAATHGERRFDHGPTGLVIVPVDVSVPLLDRGGYRKATAIDVAAELAVLEARIAILKSF